MRSAEVTSPVVLLSKDDLSSLSCNSIQILWTNLQQISYKLIPQGVGGLTKAYAWGRSAG